MDEHMVPEPGQAKNNLVIPGAILGAGLLIAGAIIYANGGPRPINNGTTPPPSSGPGEAQTLTQSESPSLGDPNAPITVVEFSDFQCPFCGKFFNETYPTILDQYIRKGKLRLVYRHFPLASIHPEADPAAQASMCAHEQGKFGQYHDLLFKNQARLSAALYQTLAAEAGLDSSAFAKCMADKKYASFVQQDFAAGQAASVSGTPTFIFAKGKEVHITGADVAYLRQQIQANQSVIKLPSGLLVIIGAHPLDTFRAQIDTLLK